MTPKSLCLHQRFEQQVADTPGALALTFAGEHLTYHELNVRANRLAAWLREAGVQPETRVGLCLERGFDTVIAILAVLKAGGAYVPMDPVYPADRVRMIVEDAECPVVLAHRAHADRFAGESGVTLLVLDGEDRPWEACPDENLPCVTSPDSLAYVIYTSGSTGRPKGALISHWNVYRLVTEMEPWFDTGPDDVWTLFHSYAFDFSVWEIWGAYFYGGRVVVVPYLVSRSPEQFYQLLLDERVTVLNQTPSAFKQLQHHDETVPIETARALALRYVIFGGETLDMPGLKIWFDRHGDQKPHLVNMYGITETTVFVTYRPVSMADTQPGTPNFIGIPIPDLTLYVLDDQRRPVGAGEVGELYVGGDGVGGGYLKRPELTAERFVPDPLAEDPDRAQTFYKTGDLVRVWENDLEFLGRNDMQVQLRGFRVELGEIETALNTHPAVRGSVVRMREDTSGDQRLVAYYLARGETPAAEFRAHLGRTLPDYMIPSVFVPMEAFPLNNNGKIDVAALPAPPSAGGGRALAPPETPTEEALLAIWEAVLGVADIGVEDDFFQLGGHSLLLTRLLLRIRDAFGVDLPLGAVMAAPAIRALAAAIDAAAPSDRHAADPIPMRDPGQPAPLSFAQERLWIIDHLEPGNTVYNIPIRFEIGGRPDADVLGRAIQAVVDRHDALRTLFPAEHGHPVQRVQPDLVVPLERLEAPGDGAGDWFRDTLRAAAREYMDLASGPLVRFLYAPDCDDRAWLGLVAHHNVFDGWSISVLLDDLAVAYAALAAGRAPEWPDLPCQYPDFAIWQRKRAQGPEFQAHLDYWREHLAGPLPRLELITDFPRPPRQSWAGAVALDALDAPLAEALGDLARNERKTLFTVLLAAWNVLLHRYTGQEDLVTGSVIAGRTHAQLENLIGFFVNTVALRTRPVPDQTFPAYLGAVESTVLAAQEHQDVPFDRVVAELRLERDPSRSPIFQVMFILHNTPRYVGSLNGIAIAGEEISNGGAKFDLTLAVTPQDSGLRLEIEYNTALFTPETAARLLANYQTLLADIVAGPNRRLDEFEIVHPRERARVRDVWNATAAPLDRAQTIISCFEARVVAHPGAMAVADESESLTYAELGARANQLAHALIERGVVPGDPVPFYLNRTLRAVVAKLGILKAGAAYVPLDLMDPVTRRDRVLSALNPRLILTEESLTPNLAGLSCPLFCLDAPGLLEAYPAEAPALTLSGADLAYIIFTSGSTGVPKGVRCLHQGVVNQVQDIQSRCPIGPGDAGTLWTAFSFDVSVYETWTCLLNGAALHVIPEHLRLNADDCFGWMRDRRITAGFLPGFLLPALLDWQRRDPLPLRRLLVGVEPLSEALLCDIVRATPGLALFNSYGPTEATEHVTLYPVADANPRPAGNAPIGKPIANTRLYVLDGQRKPVPAGVRGELYIGGDCLAEGYHGDPELTARQFVPDPFSADPDARLYRTGDLVYFRPDGNVQFVRRIGRFIKLHGLRIEPGEIESALRAHPAVADAAALLYEADRDDARIVAYLAPRPGVTDRPDDFDEFLADRLPQYMRPSQIVWLDALPRTVQGKLDRAAIPDPPRREADAGGADPETEWEKGLAELWRDLLGVARAGLNDNFFRLGGHSLLLVRLGARIRDRFQVDLPIRALMETPVLKAQARELADAAARGKGLPDTDPIQPVATDAPIPLSFAQERLWIIEQIQPGNIAYNLPVLIALDGPMDPARFHRAFEILVARHDILRVKLLPGAGGAPVQVVEDRVDIPLVVNPLPGIAAPDRAAAVREALARDARRPFDLNRAPLFRLALYPAESGTSHAAFIAHHAVLDGWSIRILIDEWAACYAALGQDREPELPELPVQFTDFAAWQRERAASGAFHDHLDYWRDHLGSPPPILELPLDFPRPPRQTWEGAVVENALDAGCGEAISALARREGRPLFTVLLAAWFLLLHRYAGQDDLVVGTALAGRPRRELEPLIGFFVNTLPLRTHVDRDEPLADFLARLDALMIAAQEHQDAPLDQIVAAVSEDRDPSRSPLFQTVCVLHNTPELEAQSGGVRLRAETVNPGTAKFDLTLAIHQQGPRLLLNLEYNTALFLESTAERYLKNYAALLNAMAAQADARIGALDYLDRAERSRLLSLRGGAVLLDHSQSLHAIVARHACENPDAPALADETVTLTYAQLEQRASAVAEMLRDRGVQPGEMVPFYLSRTVLPVVAMLGILKAGAAYVPLDLQDPAARRNRVLAVLEARVLLAETALMDELRDIGLEVVPLDSFELSAPSTDGVPDAVVGADQPAYVIFTSGSTGEPKGVCCNHLGVINLVDDLQRRQPAAPGTWCSVWAALSFDASVYEVWTALLAGAAVRVAPESVRLAPDRFLNWLGEHGVACAYLPGYMLPALRGRQQHGDPLPLTRIMAGVEPLPEALLADIVRATPGLLFVNAYGPTEVTVYATLYPVPGRADAPAGNAPIGRPIQNTRVYLLDAARDLTPAGAHGEVYVGGAGLAIGYHRDAQLTEAHFIPDPFTPGERLYRTGDVAYLRPDGELQFVRRLGRYIKMRGYRIEPGEIAAMLRRRPDIAEVEIDVYGVGHADERLVAYVVPAAGAAPDEGDLRRMAADELPPHMRPSQYVFLDALPRTVQGKIDRPALPAPPPLQTGTGDAPPEGPIENALATLWRDALGLDALPGRHDNFFSLGGNSLLAIQLATRINEDLGYALSLADLLDAPTVASLAARVAAPIDKAPSGLFVLKTGGRTPFFCASGAGDVMGYYGPLAAALAPDQPFYCYSGLVHLDGGGPQSMEEMAAEFIREVRAIQPEGPYLLGGYSFGGLLAWEAARQLLEAGQEVAGLYMLDVSVREAANNGAARANHALRAYPRKILVRLAMVLYTWRLQVGYLRDFVLDLPRMIAPSGNGANPGVTASLRWIALDTLNQYLLIRAGLATQRISDRRLRMIRERTVHETSERIRLLEQAHRNYVLRPLQARVTVLRVADDPWREARADETLGWKHFALRGVGVRVVPGNHMVMHREPFVRDLGAALQQCFEDALRRDR
ncbi:MAG: amino acid adenylation domain-containing protein [Candidatus Hydrogenedentes bacterium]|nr:amino acid adenylation domain-containing protein [Candidatus Hydrogenedentota bacterium]